MIYGYNVCFKLETSLNDSNMEDAYSMGNCIFVCEDETLVVEHVFTLVSEKRILSGQEAYYYTNQPFEKANKDFSWALEIRDVVTLIWDANQQNIMYQKGNHYTSERLRFWIYHTFFPLVLELNNTYNMLHIGAVEIADEPVLFSALSYGGKSTLTNYFLQQGHLLLSDDSLAIEKREDGYYAVPSYPYHRPYREVETLGYYTDHFFKKIKKVHHMYVLEKVDAKDQIRIEEVRGIEKFKAFHYSSFIDFDFMKARRLAFFSGIAKQVCVYKISIPWDMERLPEVYEAICTHQQKI